MGATVGLRHRVQSLTPRPTAQVRGQRSQLLLLFGSQQQRSGIGIGRLRLARVPTPPFESERGQIQNALSRVIAGPLRLELRTSVLETDVLPLKLQAQGVVEYNKNTLFSKGSSLLG